MRLNLDKLRARGIEAISEPSGAYRISVECLLKLPTADLRSLPELLKDAVEDGAPIKALLYQEGIRVVTDAWIMQTQVNDGMNFINILSHVMSPQNDVTPTPVA